NFVDDAVVQSPGGSQVTDGRPDWLTDLEVHDIFDVRPVIESGSDPLQAILKRYKQLPEGKTLCIINSFIPYPLIQLLESKGAKTRTETQAPKLHRSYFHKKVSDAEPDSPTIGDQKNTIADPGQTTFND